MNCSVCGRVLPEQLPYSPYVIWKGHLVGECCYDSILSTLKAESVSGDASLLYDFDGVFSDRDQIRYHICQHVMAGPGNMGYARILQIRQL